MNFCFRNFRFRRCGCPRCRFPPPSSHPRPVSVPRNLYLPQFRLIYLCPGGSTVHLFQTPRSNDPAFQRVRVRGKEEERREKEREKFDWTIREEDGRNGRRDNSRDVK